MPEAAYRKTGGIPPGFSICGLFREGLQTAPSGDGFRADGGCTSLTNITFPEATSIGDSAFRNCTDLETADFPKATSIGNYAFYHCESLISASFPEVTSIGNYAFVSTGETALAITMGATPPTVGVYMFVNVNESKTVTVLVPSSAVSSYNTTWQDAFKGRGNDGSGTTGTVNENIKLTIQSQ